MLSQSSAPVAPVEHRAGRCATGVGVSFVTTCATTTVVSQTITVAAPSKIFVIANGLFENNFTQSGTGGSAFVALVDSSNTAVALTASIEVSVPGNASGASEQFLTQGVLGHLPGTTVNGPAGNYHLNLDFDAAGRCAPGAEQAVVEDAALTCMTLGS
jgi:hypothetical protein